MKVVAIADVHGRLPRISAIPECEILLIAGDLCPDFPNPWDAGIMCARQTEWLQNEYAAWEKVVPAKHIFMTPGNHDWITCLPDGLRTKLFIDAGIELEGKNFWFTPWITPIGSWNYMADRATRKTRFAMIPEGLDLLVSHSPAHEVMDRSYSEDLCGCPELRQAIYRAKPKVCVFGHIHEGWRGYEDGRPVVLGKTLMYNVAKWGAMWRPRMLDI